MYKRTYLILQLFSEIVLKLKLFETLQILALASTQNYSTNYPMNTTTVERIATFSNGCYKQRIVEPEARNSTRFVETEQLICPPAVNISAFTMLTQQLQLNGSATNHTIHFLPVNNTPVTVLPPTSFVPAKSFTNVTYYVPVVAPANSYPAVLMPSPAVPSKASSHTPPNPFLNHQQSYIPAMVAANVTPHTAVLSKKVGFFGHEKKISSATSIKCFNWSLVFMTITIILCLKFMENQSNKKS